MKIKSLILLMSFLSIVALGGCSKKEADPAADIEKKYSNITEDNALDEADKILKEIDAL
jgi:hypothetical protein